MISAEFKCELLIIFIADIPADMTAIKSLAESGRFCPVYQTHQQLMVDRLTEFMGVDEALRWKIRISIESRVYADEIGKRIRSFVKSEILSIPTIKKIGLYNAPYSAIKAVEEVGKEKAVIINYHFSNEKCLFIADNLTTCQSTWLPAVR